MLYLHENLRKYRTERGLTQEEAAEVFGVSAQAVSRWETASACPDVELLPAIANYYGVTLDALVGVTESYLTTQLERGFSTLDFYKSLLIPPTSGT